MRIAHVALHFAEYAFALSLELARDHDVLLVLEKQNFRDELGDEYLADLPERLSVRFIEHAPSPRAVLNNARELVRLVEDFRPDVLHAQEVMRDAFFLAMLRLRRHPFVLTVHDPKPHTGTDFRAHHLQRHGIYVRLHRRRCDWAIVHGSQLVKDLVKDTPRLRGRVSPVAHGVLGALPADTQRAAQEMGTLLFFGRLEAYKGLEDFVAAVETIDTSQNVTAIIAGRGPALDPVRERVMRNPRFEVINHYLSRREVINVFDRAQVIVQPYRDATQSGVSLMAIGRARAVVATDVGSLSEVVRHGDNGLLVPPERPDLLARTLAEVLVQDRTPKFEDGARRLSATTFNWTRIADQHVEVYGRAVRAWAEGRVRRSTHSGGAKSGSR
ncbi:hypothetical protein N802_00250 [Knoellia sinensis KCTC 19936]|uniref:D-inositol 3-phosphate glycosyltransferase n=1 Tax=Knoellia sinensis KCTC 19936 TaxID=1385520 RepID=A0A0A0JFY0_9MICO|nr:glycosyltransferase family 4 protein [Knoellia sinensis]KGN34977.1 hypothetical protein N802_00250 [Knoellia sinensis KCTC 19936]